MSGGDSSTRAGRPPRPPDPPDDSSSLRDVAVSGCLDPPPEPAHSAEELESVPMTSDMTMDETSDDSNEPTHARDLTAAGRSTAVWTPAGVARLRGIGVAPATATVAEATVEQRLFHIATKDYPLYDDDSSLRPMTSDERTALSAYVERRLDLPGPPTFLVCTTPGLQRAAMMAYHQFQVEGTLIADVPARARLGKSLHRRSILREISAAHARNEGDRIKMRLFVLAAQRVVFDGNHTLSFVFMSKRAAAVWANTELRQRDCTITLRSAETTSQEQDATTGGKTLCFKSTWDRGVRSDLAAYRV
uniref:Uncharacterized protein n=1 Tax=Peronospora matthiolae TaxID=2874970 RepID=A0AAV1UQ88_9STRA